MGWLYHRNYFGPDRRTGRFEVRFLERRAREQREEGTRASLQGVLRDLFARGLRWVDVTSYFGPDRRSGAFSHFFLERRKQKSGGAPPSLHAALRQLRVRVMEADNADGRHALRERMIATALLADAQGRAPIGDLLTQLAARLETAGDDDAELAAFLQSNLLTAEATLGDAARSVA
jgi:hypothetical protein